MRRKIFRMLGAMSGFERGLETVISALEEIRLANERPPRAALGAMEKLRLALPPDKAARLASLQERVAICVKCPHLASSRTQTVFGIGNPNAQVMFIGEAPGVDEDLRGEPFVGRAGQLLTKIIETMGFTRDEIYIANILKCRPDMAPGAFGNRPPTAREMETCLPYLIEQIEIIEPRILVALGGTAVEGLLKIREPVGKMRGRWHAYNDIPLMITYHPSYLLRNQSPSEKRKVWEDMLQVLERLDRSISQKQRNYFL